MYSLLKWKKRKKKCIINVKSNLFIGSHLCSSMSWTVGGSQLHLLFLCAPACCILVSFSNRSVRLKLHVLLPIQVLVGYCVVKWQWLQLSRSLFNQPMKMVQFVPFVSCLVHLSFLSFSQNLGLLKCGFIFYRHMVCRFYELRDILT